MPPIDLSAITTDQLFLPQFAEKKVSVSVLRLDKIHPLVSGNKWFKLQYYLKEAKEKGQQRIVTFGGAWSNHIIAAAAACRLQQLPCTGIIRGERPAELSLVLREASTLGMEIEFISREDFATQQLPAHLNREENCIVPAGGYGPTGARGAAEMLDHAVNSKAFTHICCAVGTGTMLAGLQNRAAAHQQVIGISILKNNFQLEKETAALLTSPEKLPVILHDHHFGGYAKYQPALLQFMNEWYRQTGIATDFVYTGKLCYAVNNLIVSGYFPEGSNLLLIHSGGLTGNRSLKNGLLIF